MFLGLTMTHYNYYRSIEKPLRNDMIDLLVNNFEEFSSIMYTSIAGNDLTKQERRDLVEKYLRTGCGIVIATDSLKVIGVSLYYLDTLIQGLEESEENLLINFTLVDPEFRSKGVGNAFYEFYEDLNTEEYKRPIMVRGVWGNNPIQEHLLKKHGFEVGKDFTYKGVTRHVYVKPKTVKLFEENKEYLHKKTSNVYEYLGLVHPVEQEPKNYTTSIIAQCCENKLVRVKIFFEDGKWYYVTPKNPDLAENTKVKVLYTREDVLWLRSEDDFHKEVEVNGEITPRFVPLFGRLWGTI